MVRPRASAWVVGAVLSVAALAMPGCADTPDEETSIVAEGEAAAASEQEAAAAEPEEAALEHDMMTGPTARSKAADLRAALDILLTEHVNLAAAATGAALGGRIDEFKAAVTALDQNSVAVSMAVGSIYGPEVEATFLTLWREHIDLLVDYTVATGSGDTAAQDEAVGSLMEYSDDLTNFLSTVNPDLPRAEVTELLKTHAATLKAVVDAQAATNPVAAYHALHLAHDHMNAVAAGLAETIVQQYPERFE